MGFFEALKKWNKARFYLCLFLVGVVFVGVSLLILLSPKRETAECEATIVRIEEAYDYSLEEWVHDVFVSYEVNGEKYEEINIGNNYSTGYKVGKVITIEYDLDDPALATAAGGEFLPYILLCAGVLIMIGSVAAAVFAVKGGKEKSEREERVFAQADEALLTSIRENPEPTVEYYFHFTGKLNQSYILETPTRRPVYAANCDKMGAFTPFTFTFTDYSSGKSETKKVGHAVTTRYGSKNFSVPDSSYFTIDGVDCWQVLFETGYTIRPVLQGIKLNFTVYRYGVEVANLEAAGTNILKDEADSFLGEKLPAAGLFKVRCKQADIPAVFLACFIASRVDFF